MGSTHVCQTLPASYFLIEGGLCFSKGPWCQMINLLMVPCSKIDTIMYLAHSHTLEGHLGAHNTLEKVWDRFHWAGMEVEVKNFCHQCPHCQLTAPQKAPQAPLIPVTTISVLFKRIGMDLVGLLLKSA